MIANPSQEGPSQAADLFEQYSPSPGAFDEMESAPGIARPHWAEFIESIRRLGRQELASRSRNGRQIISSHSVTYNVYGDPQGMNRPWDLDLVPLLVTGEDWAKVEQGLIQRSHLLNLILLDLYGGGQRLLRDGFVPPELVYSNSGFLRPCRGIALPNNVYLHLHACDLGRGANGQWWVLADRTQAPSGAGYALENRTVVSRLLPDEMRECNVQRLANFFRTESEMLLSLAPGHCTNPSVVLLTPGAHNETYFEHAYLARHLGFPLVEGADLTVRDRRVFLKTLEGLQPVDVILRRVDDSFCDPLEMRSESFLGVAGLVEATRAGTVAVANALGSGLVESPAFLPFLPGLCRHLLGEELLIPSVATWWCGQANELRYVLEHLNQLVIKPAFGPRTRQPWFVARMSSTERARLKKIIQVQPRDFVAQEHLNLSRAPVWVDNHFEPRSVVVRAYVASGGSSHAVLPGGLTRVSRTVEDPVVLMQVGSGSKDTWVLGNGLQSRAETTLLASEPQLSERALAGIASRAADNLFWLGRYTERLEHTLRVLRCVIGRVSDESGNESAVEWEALAELMVRIGLLSAGSIPSTLEDLQREVLQLVYKPHLTGSVREMLGRIRFIVSAVRDRFSGDTWRILGRLEADARTRPGRLPLVNARTLIHNLVLDLAAFNGMEMENMTRGQGWRFLDLGRRLERSVNLVLLLRGTMGLKAGPAAALEPVLEIADSVMTYRRRYFAEVRLSGVLELLLRDESNPRALAFQLNTLEGHVRDLPRDVNVAAGTNEPQRILELNTLLKATHWAALGNPARGPGIGPSEDVAKSEQAKAWTTNESLEDLLDRFTHELTAFSEDLTNHYFSHTEPRVS